MAVVETALAKFDLAIHINPRKQDGFYPVDYLDCQIDICDELSFCPKLNGIEIVCNNPNVPTNEDNFIYQAAILLKKMAGRKDLGAKIVLKKQIPVTAGFGGGSSDAAAAVRGLCRLWKIKLDKKQIETLARNLGKDFFYSLHGGLGEVISRGKYYEFRSLAAHLPKFHLVVIVPKEQKLSSGWVYQNLKEEKLGQHKGKHKGLEKAIKAGNSEQILANLHNDFEDAVFQFFPQIDKMKHDLVGLGAKRCLMAGAGLSMVGFFDSRALALRAKRNLAGNYPRVMSAKIVA